MFVINAKKRDASGSLAHLRQAGEIPAVFYGAGKKNTPVSISTAEFKKLWRQAGESSAVVVKTGAENIDVLIHEVQVDPVTDEPIHVDFLAIDMTKKIKVKVPLDFTGISNAVKNGLGNLVKVLYEVEVEALPKDLPHNLSVDISKLATVEDTILVSDIKLPSGVVVIEKPEDVVASIILQVEEKEEEPVPVDLSAIEVEKKGKKDEEGAEGAEVGEATAPVKEPARNAAHNTAGGEKTQEKK
jgi:large subunit ribosomal protein L25